MLQTFLGGLDAFVNWLMGAMKQIWALYTSQPILMFFLAVFIVHKVMDIFGYLKGR